MTGFAEIRFKGTRKDYFAYDGLDLRPGQNVIVEADRARGKTTGDRPDCRPNAANVARRNPVAENAIGPVSGHRFGKPGRGLLESLTQPHGRLPAKHVGSQSRVE